MRNGSGPSTDLPPLRAAQDLGVVLCVEPINRFETYFLNTQADAASLVHSIGAPNVKIHFDTFHANIEERHPVDSLRSIASDSATSTFRKMTAGHRAPAIPIGKEFFRLKRYRLRRLAHDSSHSHSRSPIWQLLRQSGEIWFPRATNWPRAGFDL